MDWWAIRNHRLHRGMTYWRSPVLIDAKCNPPSSLVVYGNQGGRFFRSQKLLNSHFVTLPFRQREAAEEAIPSRYGLRLFSTLKASTWGGHKWRVPRVQLGKIDLFHAPVNGWLWPGRLFFDRWTVEAYRIDPLQLCFHQYLSKQTLFYSWLAIFRRILFWMSTKYTTHSIQSTKICFSFHERKKS